LTIIDAGSMNAGKNGVNGAGKNMAVNTATGTGVMTNE
jgi:hypothetical protein